MTNHALSVRRIGPTGDVVDWRPMRRGYACRLMLGCLGPFVLFCGAIVIGAPQVLLPLVFVPFVWFFRWDLRTNPDRPGLTGRPPPGAGDDRPDGESRDDEPRAQRGSDRADRYVVDWRPMRRGYAWRLILGFFGPFALFCGGIVIGAPQLLLPLVFVPFVWFFRWDLQTNPDRHRPQR